MNISLGLMFSLIIILVKGELMNITAIEEVNKKEKTRAKTNEEYHVKTLKEFLDVIGDNRTIYLEEDINISRELEKIVAINEFKEGDYDSQFDEYLYPREKGLFIKSRFYQIELNDNIFGTLEANFLLSELEEYMPKGFFITVKNTKNLKIIGKEDGLTKIIIENDDSAVLNFYNNSNLILKNIKAFHDLPVEVECGIHAPVLQFRGDFNVKIDNCDLNGSGTQGIYATDLKHFKLENSVIHNCSSSAMTLINSDFCFVEKCEIVDNDFSVIFSTRNSFLVVEGTKIEHNSAYNIKDEAFVSYNPHAWSKLINKVSFVNCIIVNNVFDGDNEIEFNKSNTIDYSQFNSDKD